jgi:hypothetical protein
MAKRSNDKAYAPESQLLEELQEFLETENANGSPSTKEEYKAKFEIVLNQYDRLLSDVKLLTSVGDRLQRKLKSANMMLEQQKEEIAEINSNLSQTNAELKITIDELTRTRASRKAQTYILFIALGLFFVSEILEEIFESQLQGTGWDAAVSWIFKTALVFVIKPIERYLESRMLRAAMDQEKRELVEKLVNTEEEVEVVKLAKPAKNLYGTAQTEA